MRTLVIILLVLTTVCASAAKKAKAPREFVTQILEPTGGKIQCPKKWFYTEDHFGASYTWILSREDASKAPYTTGFRIQMLVGVREGAGKTPKQFVLDYVDSKKREAKVLKTCRENNQGMFTRVCLETEEGPASYLVFSLLGQRHRSRRSIYCWHHERTVGHVRTDFDRMNHFELIDMKHFMKRFKKNET